MNKSIEFFNAINDVWNKPVPEDVMSRARQSLLDYIAVTCAGAKFQKSKLEKYFDFAEPEKGAFKAIGTKQDVSLKEAMSDFIKDKQTIIPKHLKSVPLQKRYMFAFNSMLFATIREAMSKGLLYDGKYDEENQWFL